MEAVPLIQRATPPNPFEPVIGLKLGSARPESLTDCGSPYRRRAQILAETRRILAEQGGDQITLKSVAGACAISTQTIHNIFGSKSQLLSAAMNQHTLLIDSHAVSITQDASVFLWLALAYCRSATEWPEFTRQFVQATFSTKLSLREILVRFGTDLKLQILRGLAKRKLIRPYVDPRMAAEQIAYVNTFAMLEWAENDDIRQLYERIIHGNGSVLLGILTPEAGKDIENWLAGRFNPHWLLQEDSANS